MAAAGMPALVRLFSPLRLGYVELRNRIVSTAHSTGLSDGTKLGNRAIAYYAALANWDDSVIGPYRRLAAAVHCYGTCLFVQLNDAGALSGGTMETARIVAPPAIDSEVGDESRIREAGTNLNLDALPKAPAPRRVVMSAAVSPDWRQHAARHCPITK